MTEQELHQRKRKIENEIAEMAPGLDYTLVWESDKPVIRLNESVSPEMEKLLLQIAEVALPRG